MGLDFLGILEAGLLSLGLSLLTIWILKHPGSETARSHLLNTFGAATIWSWFVMARNIINPSYSNKIWDIVNLCLGAFALYATWRTVRWIIYGGG